MHVESQKYFRCEKYQVDGVEKYILWIVENKLSYYQDYYLPTTIFVATFKKTFLNVSKKLRCNTCCNHG